MSIYPHILTQILHNFILHLPSKYTISNPAYYPCN